MTSTSSKRIAVVQSNYIPWKGYFDMMARVDEFVLFDDVQFTRRDWRNRNLIKTANGPLWLTIPVLTKSKYEQRICDTEIADQDWARRHWLSIAGSYKRAPGFRDIAERLEMLFSAGASQTRLSGVNRLFLDGIRDILGISTPLVWSMDYPADNRKSERLLGICRAAGASHYLSGPAARAYLDESLFANAGIAVEWMSYGPYPTYEQLHGPFMHNVSLVDLLAHVGDRSGAYLRGGRAEQ